LGHNVVLTICCLVDPVPVGPCFPTNEWDMWAIEQVVLRPDKTVYPIG